MAAKLAKCKTGISAGLEVSMKTNHLKDNMNHVRC